MIVVDQLTRRFGSHTAVSDVSFRVARGEILGFLGPNGAGKTTTMRVLTSYLPPTTGRVSIAGYDVTRESREARSHIGYLPESVPLYRDMTVSGYLEFVATLKDVPRANVPRLRDRAMETCGVADVRRRPIGNLSRGYRQRVGLAQALINNPDVLVLDEPTVGLDPRQIVEIRELIRSLSGQRTTILSTHILPEISLLCTRVLIINRGRVVSDGAPGELGEGSRGKFEIEVVVGRNADRAASTLKSVGGIESVTELGVEATGGRRLRIVASEACDPRQAVADCLVGDGIGLLSLEHRRQNLEDIFVRLVTREEGVDA